MKVYFLLFFLLLGFLSFGQHDQKISTMDFVEVLNGNQEEALYFYEHNWKKLREIALEKGYINSFKFFKTEPDEGYPISFILVTTYSNKEQFEKREDHFSEVMKIKGDLELLNEKKPGDFRRTLFSKEKTFYLE